MTEIPEWIQDLIEFDPNREVQDRHIVECFLDSDRPYLSRRQVQEAVGLSAQSVRDRLGDLEELGVLDNDRVSGGRVYWIRSDVSEWPLPPDVEVRPRREEPTVSELLDRTSVQYGVLAIIATMFGSLLMVAFTAAAGYGLTPPYVHATDFLFWGLVVIGVGYVLVLMGAVVWVFEQRRGGE